MASVSVLGIDISHHNGTIDFGKVAIDDIHFVLMKATESSSFVDSKFATNWQKSGQSNLKRGAYHFFRPNVSGKDQAKHFVSKLIAAGVGKGDIIPTVDCEDYDGSGAKAYQKELQIFLDVVEGEFKKKPIIYTLRSFWKKIGDPIQFGGYPLWVVDLTSSDKPRLPSGWNDYAIWQFTFEGTTKGISGLVDKDRFNGDLSGLSSLII